MRYVLFVLTAVALLSPAIAAGDESKGEYLLITPKPWAALLKPLLTLRAAGGYRVAVVTTDTLTGARGEVSDSRIAAVLAKRKPTVCVLVGDVPQNMPKAMSKIAVPTRYVLPGVYGGKGRATIASDTAYGVFRSVTRPVDDEPSHTPTVQIGRLSAKSADALKIIVSKIVAAEKPLSFGKWRRRVNIVAGSPSYGPLVDTIIENLATQVLAAAIAPRFQTTMTYANANSIYCWPPPTFAKKAVERFNEGCLIYAYVGHGSSTSVAGLYDPARKRFFDVLNARTAGEFAAPAATATICFLITCGTGRFDGNADSLAEVLAATRGGPVAVIASSRVSWPYANAVLGKQLLEAICRDQRPTVGDVLVRAFAKMLAGRDPKDAVRLQLDTAAMMMKRGLASPAERIKHVYLYNLFGDPATPIPYPPIRASVAVEGKVSPGGSLSITITTATPLDGDAEITVEIPRTANAFAKIPRQKTPRLIDKSFEINYANALRKTLARAADRMTGGRLQVTIKLPPTSPMYTATDRFDVKVYVTGKTSSAFGAATVGKSAE